MSVGADCSPRRRARRRDRPRACAPSRRRPSSSPRLPALSPSSASSSLKRVSTVRRSCETPASIAVRCSIARSMRVFISMKACAARRTSRAPRGRKFGTSRPLPKLSAASASRRIGLIWLRRKRIATVEQHQRGADHPEQEDLRVRRVGRAARARTPASPCRRAGCGFRPAPSGRRCRSRTAGRSACAVPPTAPGRAARRTASGPAAAYRVSGRKSTTRPSRSCAMRRICALVGVLRIALGRCRSARRCPAPRRPTAAASPRSSAAP